jgi:hypothetical protein
MRCLIVSNIANLPLALGPTERLRNSKNALSKC